MPLMTTLGGLRLVDATYAGFAVGFDPRRRLGANETVRRIYNGWPADEWY
jgi:hypothetical protein